ALPFFALYILWLPRSFAAMFGPSFWLGFPLLLAILAVFWGLTTWASWRLAGGVNGVPAGRRVLLLLPAAWVLVEWARTQGYFAFPWGTLGYAWLDTPVAQLADVIGVYGLSLLVTVPAALLAVVFVQPGKRSRATGGTLDLRLGTPRAGLVASGPSGPVAALAAVAMVAGALAWGATRGPDAPLADEAQPPSSALLVQGNVDPFARAVNAARELRIHLDLTVDGAASTAVD